MPKILIVDTSALVHRAYHAFPDTLTNKEGLPTNAIYGFTTLLLSAIEKVKPEYIVCAFDTPKPTFRHQEFVDYKAHRKPMEDNLKLQFPHVEVILNAFKIPILKVEGFEADDVIGTLVERLPKIIPGVKKVILTGDSDEYQLLDSDTDIFMAARFFRDSKISTYEEIKTKLMYDPENVPDYKSLRGDSSDNIPGVKGIGEKTATELVSKYKTLENVYANLDKIDKKVAEKLINAQEIAYMSKKIAIISRDVPLNIVKEDLKFSGYKVSEIIETFKKYEFRSLVSKVIKLFPENIPSIPTTESLSGQGGIFDQVGTSKPKLDLSLAKESASLKSFDQIYVYMTETKIYLSDSKEYVSFDLTDVQNIKECIKKDSLIIGNDIKGFMHLIDDSSFKYFDVSIASYIFSGGKTKKDLESQFIELFNSYDLLSKEDISSQIAVMGKIYDYHISYIEKHAGEKIVKLLIDVEMPLVKVLFSMEKRGILLDKEVMKKVKSSIEKSIAEVVKKIYALIGHEINISSPKQVGEALVSMGIPLPKKSKTGSYSTDEGTLSKFASSFEICDQILRHRELAKLLSTYVDSFTEITDKESVIHTTYNQNGALTGRLSSTNPNLQNIPFGTPESDLIRSAFIARPGYKFVSLDYSQQELRILASVSKEESLIEAYKKGMDIHKLTATAIFDVKYEDVTKEQRAAAKTVNFGVVYGISSFGLSEQLKIPVATAQKFIDSFFDKFPNILKYFKDIEKEAKEKGYIGTILGRIRYFPDLNSKNFQLRNRAYRELINFPIQGSAADMTKSAMVSIYNSITKFKGWSLLLQIHDELLFEVEENALKDKTSLDTIKEIMNSVMPLSVPVLVESNESTTWVK